MQKVIVVVLEANKLHPGYMMLFQAMVGNTEAEE